MSMFENDQYRWRETYFILFLSAKRPTLEKVQETISSLGSRFTLTNLSGDDSGRFESLTVLAPDDFAALDICYVDGEEVLEQGAMLAEEIEAAGCTADDEAQIERIRQCDGRFDVLHFEQIVDSDDDVLDGMLDPSALLIVLEALAKLSDGMAIDPQGGTML